MRLPVSSERVALTFADYVRARSQDDNVAIRSHDGTLTYRVWCEGVAERAAMWRKILGSRPEGTAPHIGVLLENSPEFTMWLGAAAVTGSVIVGINPTRRGAELARDITHTSCQIVVTESSQSELLDGLDLGIDDCVLVVESDDYKSRVAEHRGSLLPTAQECPVNPTDTFLLLFTSGTSGAPKAVITSHQRLGFVAQSMNMIIALTPEDTTYICMPLFHSNALFTAWAPSLVFGSTIALRRKFSASEFLSDVRTFGATYFNYVGKPLTYILATPEQSNDRDNPLRRGFGNEGSEIDLLRFAERFDCKLTDGYGQTETGASIVRIPNMPAGSLGVAAQATITVRDPATNQECPRAIFDSDGRLMNSEEATGEIVNGGGGTFEGYWNNAAANEERIRDGAYWTGDLAYRDENGFFYFAGRSADWMRVDGENFAGAPIERILMRHPDVILAAVYGVPDFDMGDRVMAAMQLQPGATFDPAEFAEFLNSQTDLGPKWVPSFIEIVDDFPMTPSNKVIKRELVLRRWHNAESDSNARIWLRPGKEVRFERFGVDEAQQLRSKFTAHQREGLLG
jgi:fatty-acyl-CoA synthase